MTIQLRSQQYGKSKATLQEALNTTPTRVWFEDPSIFPGSRGQFTGADVKPGERFPLVMDHPKRSRFATLQRRPDGTFKVS